MEELAQIFGLTFVGVIVICIGWTVMEYIFSQPNRQNKKLMNNMKELDRKIKKEVNSISPLFNDMTGLEVRKMMEEDFKKNYKSK